MDDQELELELEQALKKWDSKFKMKSKLSLGSVKDVATTPIEVASITKSVTDKTSEINGKDTKGSKEIGEKKISLPSVSTSPKNTVSITASTVSAPAPVPTLASIPVVMKSNEPATTTPTAAATTASSGTVTKDKWKEDSKMNGEKITVEKTLQTPSPSELTKTVKTATTSSTTSTGSPLKKSTSPILSKEKVKVKETIPATKTNTKENISKKNISTNSPSSTSGKKSSSLKNDKKSKNDLPGS